MDADLTSFLKGRRLAWACREHIMRAGLENVDGKRKSIVVVRKKQRKLIDTTALRVQSCAITARRRHCR